MKQVLNTLFNWVRPPVFPDEEKTRVAILLNTSLWMGVIFLAIFAGLSLFSGPTRLLNLLYALLYFVMILVAFRMMHHGHVRFASLWILTMLTLVVSLGVFFSNGIYGIALSAQFIIVVLAALLVNGRTGAVFALVNILVNTVAVWFETHDLLPVSLFVETPVARLVAHGVDLAVVAGLLALASSTLLSALQRLRANEIRLQHLATHDPLTDLPNRAMFSEYLRHTIARARRRSSRFAVFFLDLDDFKPVNDVFGHAHGDEVLVSVVRHLRSVLRETDILARIGGDEFVCIVEELDQELNAALVAQRLLDVFKIPFYQGHVEIFLSISIGISLFPDDGDDPDMLLRQADAAMYTAKQNGKNQYQFFSRDMAIRSHERHLLSNQLRSALERNEFLLYYQPILHWPSGKAIAVEALLRWKREDGSPVELPEMFLHVLEENGVILEVGNWVLEEAAHQLSKWKQSGMNLRMMVNIAPRQLRFSEFFEQVAAVVKTNALAPGDLVLEFSENIIYKEIRNVKQIFTRLKDLGVGLAVDDFGNGHLSLHQLIEFPFSMLKVDKEFTAGILPGSRNVAVLAGIMSVSRELGFDLVVEGVETKEQLAELDRLGCSYVQGFMFSQPVGAVELEKMDWVFSPDPSSLT